MDLLTVGMLVDLWDISLVVAMVVQRGTWTAFGLVALSVVLWAAMMAVL